MLDKWKARRELCKAYKIYRKKTKSFLHSDSFTSKEWNQLYDIKHAIAYVLCEYFDFNYEFYYENPFSYKWYIAWDYMNYYDECKEAYEEIITNHTQEFDLVKPLKGEVTDKQYGILHDGKFDYGYVTTLLKGNVYFDIENNKQYMFDGKNLIEMC